MVLMIEIYNLFETLVGHHILGEHLHNILCIASPQAFEREDNRKFICRGMATGTKNEHI